MPKTLEQCKKIREEMRAKILKESALYFARYGFADTKISDLAKHIGIGQGRSTCISNQKKNSLTRS